MKLKFAVAFALLFFAVAARAEDVDTIYGGFVIPDGSTVTGVSQSPDIADVGPAYTVDFSFADGTGSATYNWYFGSWGEILFSTPVSDLSFGYENGGGLFEVYDNGGDSFTYVDDSGTASFTGTGITELNWTDASGGAINEISYITPEPSILLLLALGLVGIGGLILRLPRSESST